MSDKNIEVIKHVQATGKCTEDVIMATSMYSESGYQPKKVPIPPTPTKGSSATRPAEKMEVTIECPNSLSKQVDWFKRRMEEYRESFFRVCDIVEHSDCADIIKKLVEEERKRY